MSQRLTRRGQSPPQTLLETPASLQQQHPDVVGVGVVICNRVKCGGQVICVP
jgi:hypothetical protein